MAQLVGGLRELVGAAEELVRDRAGGACEVRHVEEEADDLNVSVSGFGRLDMDSVAGTHGDVDL